MPINKRATTTWESPNRAFILYQDYLAGKADRFNLPTTDLIYTSNFKGGNASGSETTTEIAQKLGPYPGFLRMNN